MGNYYIQPDFDKGLFLCTILMSDQELQKKFPLSQNAILISQSKSFLQQMIKTNNSLESPSSDFTEMLNLMCLNNIANTKKMAKVYIRELLNKNHVEDI